MVAAADLKSAGENTVGVQVPLWAFQLIFMDFFEYFPNPYFYSDDPDLSPTLAHPGEDVGFDLKSAGDYVIELNNTVIVDTGVKVFLPPLDFPLMMELQIRSRSGLAIKHGLVVVNQPGTIDPGYKDTIKVGFRYLGGNEIFYIDRGDRVAQAVFNIVLNPVKVQQCNNSKDWEKMTNVYDQRGEGGLGSTGI